MNKKTSKTSPVPAEEFQLKPLNGEALLQLNSLLKEGQRLVVEKKLGSLVAHIENHKGVPISIRSTLSIHIGIQPVKSTSIYMRVDQSSAEDRDFRAKLSPEKRKQILQKRNNYFMMGEAEIFSLLEAIEYEDIKPVVCNEHTQKFWLYTLKDGSKVWSWYYEEDKLNIAKYQLPGKSVVFARSLDNM